MINSSSARIVVAILLLMIAVMLMLVLMVPKLELRQMTHLLDSEQRQGVMLQPNVEVELAADANNHLMWWRRLLHAIDKWAPPDYICQSSHAAPPPIVILDSEESYQLYQMRPTNGAQSDLISLLLYHPLLLLLIITILISILLLLWLAWSLAKPARKKKLKYAADEVARGTLRLHPELNVGPQELLATSVSFNQMVSALERIVTTQQRLLSDIAHELRTPLTRLQLATALIRRRYGEGQELTRIETEAQRLDAMINDLLVLSRNQHKNDLSREILTANDLWSNVLSDAQFEAEQMGKSLTLISPPGNWTLLGNPSALDSALENIVRNALRYSHQQISIRFSTDPHGITIIVDDDGPGVSEKDREQIFRPFYRTDEARDRESGGTGLGLAIVETTVMQHRGWVKAQDSPLGGLRLIIWLPFGFLCYPRVKRRGHEP